MDHTAEESDPAEFTVEPYTANCRAIYARADHVLIGVSPGNGYFSQARLSRLLRWADGVFARVDAIVADSALVHTYRALGATPEQADIQAQRATRQTCRRIARAWQASGAPAERHHVRTLSEFVHHPRYRELLARCEETVESDAAVRSVFRRATESALASQLRARSSAFDPTAPTPAQVEEGMRYLMAEMPLVTDTPGILGVPSSVHVYHRMLPLVPLGFGSLFASPHQAFALVRPREDAERPPAADAPRPGEERP
ncbi:cyclo(L-tyrosyl-L-tyrosyl) synthase [Streptomyces sulfonofaciens]|uniref:Cyclodipeptide synthase n=1 Tax=Streptomyces sulfonofaciens TaxID=68272 RepID=A0A919L360_9ACTN|nr:tRNA-dependent cyclodipeptide synthase [Streptomyces sulfonofaciens]GHH82197.1 cyclo(L-tyrosyl-L-tyrosyl) synthase [Streptomyces sulfonofaciens]